eukprot:scaffold28_cov101-Isochrysis_galbana.AAC.3
MTTLHHPTISGDGKQRALPSNPSHIFGDGQQTVPSQPKAFFGHGQQRALPSNPSPMFGDGQHTISRIPALFLATGNIP